MKQLITALVLATAALTAQAGKDSWIHSVAKEIHPEVKVQKIDSQSECVEISRNLKGTSISYVGDRNQYGSSPAFSGKLNSKGQYVEMRCSSKSGNWALVAPKAVIDNLVAEQKQKQTQRSNNLNTKVQNSGLL